MSEEAKKIAAPSDVTKLLSLSEDQLDEIRKEQKRLLRLHRSRAVLSPDERLRARGVELEYHHKKTGNRNALAESYAMQGRYDMAIRTAEKEGLKAYFRELSEAARKEDKNCPCDDYINENGFLIPAQYVERYGYSEKHQATMPFIRCRICNDLNARAMPPHLAEIAAIRRAATPQTEIPFTEAR